MKKTMRLCLLAMVLCLSACTSKPITQEKKDTSSNEKVYEKAEVKLDQESKQETEENNSNEVEKESTEEKDTASSEEKNLQQAQKKESTVQSNTSDNVNRQEKETPVKETPIEQPTVPEEKPQEKPVVPDQKPQEKPSVPETTVPEVPDIPACSYEIPKGTYKSEDEAAAYAESVILDNLMNGDGSLTGYSIERAQTECGTPYYVLVIY